VRSLATAVMVESVEGAFTFGAHDGWLGEAVVRREGYGDDNVVSTAYAWLLAPLIRGQSGAFHVGYSFAAQSADENRFVPRGDVSLPPGQLPATVPGEYNPYYTPNTLRSHSALVSTSVHPGSRWTFDGDARYALSASDLAPVLVPVAAPPNIVVQRRFYDRSFTPWNARARLGVAASESVRLGFVAEHGQSAYYRYTTGGVQLTYTFVAAARKRVRLR
jgi:hypothetical protein